MIEFKSLPAMAVAIRMLAFSDLSGLTLSDPAATEKLQGRVEQIFGLGALYASSDNLELARKIAQEYDVDIVTQRVGVLQQNGGIDVLIEYATDTTKSEGLQYIMFCANKTPSYLLELK